MLTKTRIDQRRRGFETRGGYDVAIFRQVAASSDRAISVTKYQGLSL